MPSQIEFGAFITDQHDVAQTARHIESLGYDILSCGEHVAFHTPVPNAFVTLACAAGATQNIKLMSGITLLPLYPAALAAKMGAALDVASNGRFMLGVGVGGEIPKEFEACGVPLGERGARTNEALEVIRKLWTGDAVDFAGRFNTLNDVSIQPPPIQNPQPPIWVAGRQAAAMRRAGRYADGWLPYMYTPEQLQESLVQIREHAEAAGRDPDSVQAGIFLWSSVHEDGEYARQTAIDYLSKNYAQDFTKLVSRYALTGNPQECAGRLREYVEAGATLAILAPACPAGPASKASVELMAHEVMPSFR